MRYIEKHTTMTSADFSRLALLLAFRNIAIRQVRETSSERALKKVPNFKLHSLFLNFNSCPRSISSFKSEILFWTGI